MCKTSACSFLVFTDATFPPTFRQVYLEKKGSGAQFCPSFRRAQGPSSAHPSEGLRGPVLPILQKGSGAQFCPSFRRAQGPSSAHPSEGLRGPVLPILQKGSGAQFCPSFRRAQGPSSAHPAEGLRGPVLPILQKGSGAQFCPSFRRAQGPSSAHPSEGLRGPVLPILQKGSGAQFCPSFRRAQGPSSAHPSEGLRGPVLPILQKGSGAQFCPSFRRAPAVLTPRTLSYTGVVVQCNWSAGGLRVGLELRHPVVTTTFARSPVTQRLDRTQKEKPRNRVEVQSYTGLCRVGLSCINTTCFRLYFTFFQEHERPVKLASGMWNCSVRHYASFHQHLACNLKTECEDGRDETGACPYSSPPCQGMIALCNRCYTIVDHLHAFVSNKTDVNERVPTFPCSDDVTKLSYTMVCDFITDCPDESDESFCQHPSCVRQFRCTNGQCVSVDNVCDYMFHCWDQSDEQNSCLSLVGNVLCCCARLFARSLSSSSGFSVFVTNLTIADFFMGVYITIIGVADERFRGRYLYNDDMWKHSVTCKVAGFLSLLSSEVSALIIWFITLDRFIVLHFPFTTIRFNRTSAAVACLFTWLTVPTRSPPQLFK
ncbi:hypothetical protein ACOMHN_026095 [Nucella lapillus]